MININTDINSIFPIIINIIKNNFVLVKRLEKLISLTPYNEELVVFVSVRIDSLNEFSKLNINYLIFAYRGFSGNEGKPS